MSASMAQRYWLRISEAENISCSAIWADLAGLCYVILTCATRITLISASMNVAAMLTGRSSSKPVACSLMIELMFGNAVNECRR
jgi:hypothetical protein